MDRWSQWLFQEHPEDELKHWARRLSIFRYVRAYGGHANDGDELIAAYRYQSLDELSAALSCLGISLHTHAAPPPQPQVGRAYSGEEFGSFPSLIAGSMTDQPKWQLINGQRVYVWCHDGIMKISVSADYDVNESCVQAAERVELFLGRLPLERIDPPVDNRHCICPRYYAQYFS